MTVKVLVVEDSEAKVNTLSKELFALGVLEPNVIIARSAVDARRALKEHVGTLSLMLLDLALPNRPGDLPSPAIGLELLKQILEDGEYSAPDNIVGTTADYETLAEYERDFKAYTTQIFLVSPESVEWKFSLAKIIQRINRSIDAPREHKVDVCFVTALRHPELAAIQQLPIAWSPEQSLENGVLFQEGTAEINGQTKTFVCAHLTQMGLVAAAFICSSLIERFAPRLLIMTGICGGLPSTKLGDVVVANRSWDWQSGKWLHDSSFESAPDQKEASSVLTGLAHRTEEFILNFWRGQDNRPTTAPSLKVGPMVSGSAVVEDKSKHITFLHQHRKAVAVDMECFGVYFAARMALPPQPLALCIKAVSDLADRHKQDNYQVYCSQISAGAAFEVVKMHFSK